MPLGLWQLGARKPYGARLFGVFALVQIGFKFPFGERRDLREAAAVLSYPKPVSDKGVPVWFGGESNPALRRVASTATVGLGSTCCLTRQPRRSKGLKDC